MPLKISSEDSVTILESRLLVLELKAFNFDKLLRFQRHLIRWSSNFSEADRFCQDASVAKNTTVIEKQSRFEIWKVKKEIENSKWIGNLANIHMHMHSNRLVDVQVVTRERLVCVCNSNAFKLVRSISNHFEAFRTISSTQSTALSESVKNRSDVRLVKGVLREPKEVLWNKLKRTENQCCVKPEIRHFLQQQFCRIIFF